MKTRFRIALASVLIPLACLATLAMVWPREPVHDGRRLSAWLRELPGRGPGGAELRHPATQAVRQIGTNALPFLLEMLNARDPKWKSTAIEWLFDKCDIDLTSSRAETQWQLAVNGFHALGSQAGPVVPELCALAAATDGDAALGAMEALRGIGGPGTLKFFLQALESTNLAVRGEAILALGSFRSRAREAVPRLLEELESSDAGIRQQVLRALGEIAARPEQCVPALIRCLGDDAEGMPANSALALAAFGTNAQAALPALRALSTNQNELIRRAGRLATLRVQCEIQEGAILRGPKDEKRLALLFTAHEFGEGGETILNELKRHGARASFFLTGAFLANPQFKPLVERLAAEQHYLGPHSDRHLLYCSWDAARTNLVTEMEFQEDLAANVAKLSAHETEPRRFSRYFLPPFEHYNRQIADWAQARGWTLINYTPGTRSHADYTGETDRNFVSSQRIMESITAQERDDPEGLNGFLLLFHFGAGPGRADKFHSVFGELLDYLAARGYKLVRVDELLRPPRDPNSTIGHARPFPLNR